MRYLYNRNEPFCFCEWHSNVTGIKTIKIPDKQKWEMPQLSNDTIGSYPRSRSIGKIFMSGLQCIMIRIYVIWFNSTSALAEMLKLVKWRTPAGRLHFDSRQELLLNLTTYQQAPLHLFTNLLDTIKTFPEWAEWGGKTIEASLPKTIHYHIRLQGA
jgi:hypothetical protein